MRLVPSALLALVALAAMIPRDVLAKKSDAEEVQESSEHVLVLNKSNFDAQVKGENKVTLVKFYAPWCGHCKALAPEFETAAAELKDTNINLAKVDCTEEADLCQDYGVQGYPTLKIFREGGVGEYKGQRKADALVSHMKKQLLPDVTALTADSIEVFKDSDKVVVVGHFDSEEDSEYDEFKKAAGQLRDDFVFGATFDKKVAKKVGIKAQPSVTLFKQFDDGRDDFAGAEYTAEALADFVKGNSMPLLNELGPDNFMGYMESGKPLAYIFVTTDEERKTLGEELNSVAKEFKGKVNFVFIDAGQFGGHAATLNLKEEWPAFAIQEPVKQLKFPFAQEQEITGDAIRKFVQSYVDGEIDPSIKSEPIPESNDEDVKVVVADSFESLVLDKSKDVLVEFYAPWCGHCKKLAPVYDRVGAHFAKFSDRVTIAKMDSIANDIPPTADIAVEGFPTIKLIKAETNEAIDYTGDRTEESFIEFIKKNGHHSYEDVAEEVESTEEAADDKSDKAEEVTDEKKVEKEEKKAEEAKEEVEEEAKEEEPKEEAKEEKKASKKEKSESKKEKSKSKKAEKSKKASKKEEEPVEDEPERDEL